MEHWERLKTILVGFESTARDYLSDAMLKILALLR